MLYQQAGIPRKVRGCMLGFDSPFNALRVKGAHGRVRKERKTDSEDDGDDPDGDGASSSRPNGPFQWMEADLAAMQGLMSGLPRLPQGEGIGFCLAVIHYSGHFSAAADPLLRSTSIVACLLR
ncbi:hypothetical protein HAX54_018745 [Datura stramonium]|uniref:Uncharacterized protein n=1 Tax=Datura stramonium TaxID=4076 RepID=A0ABS8UQ27_DATST|nr:hypothetical protein [Datura stramonium]